MAFNVSTRNLPVGWQPVATGGLEVVQRVLVARGVTDSIGKTGREMFELSTLLDWRLLSGIEAAVDLLFEALKQQSRIVIVGDYDADGATGTALAIDLLKQFGIKQITYAVPNRFKDGYGLTPALVAFVLPTKPELIITVDNGATSFAGVDYAASHGIPVLVTDHHLCGEQLPKAVMVNPNQPGCTFPSKNLAGVGVMFYVMVALRAKLREQKWFQDCPEPNMLRALDLVALGTIADVVTLDYNNRCLVQQGLMLMRSGHARPGIAALAAVAKVNVETITSSDLAFRLAPRLNAAGRMEDMSHGINCLLAAKPTEATELAAALDGHNKRRRQRERDMQQEANQVLQHYVAQQQELPAGICLANDSWHLGLIGIIAARIRDAWNRPAMALAPALKHEQAMSSDDLWRGSVRSIAGVHIRDMLVTMNTEQPGLLESFGGHAVAAGLAIRHERLADLHKAFARTVEKAMSDQLAGVVVMTDGELKSDEFGIEVATLLAQVSPWGKGFEEPLFHGIFEVGEVVILNQQTLKLRVRSMNPVGYWCDAMLFQTSRIDLPHQVDRLQLVYELGINHYRGMDMVQLIIRRWQPAS